MIGGKRLLNRFLHDQSGQDMVEYVLLGSLIMLAAIAVTQLGSTVANSCANTFNGIVNALGS